MAKMQWSVFVLILMGQCSFFMCHLYEYHFVGAEKNWTEAQKYCREKHTDLATVSNMTDMKRLNVSARNHGEAWIGLYSDPNRNETKMWQWQWSLPGLEFNASESRWKEGQPNNKNSRNQKCVRMKNHEWNDVRCSNYLTFICYDERKRNNKTFHLINKEMTWPQAQSYCREKYTDLVSGHEQLKGLNDIRTEEVWIGLFRDSWRWSDGTNHSFRYWDLKLFKDEDSSKRCAMTLRNGKWSSDKCDKTKPFFCYGETTTKRATTAGPSSSTVTTDKTQETTTKRATTAGHSSSTVTTDKTQGTTTKRATTAGRSSSTVTTDKTQETTTKRATTAGPSSSTVTTDKTQDKVILINESMTWEDALNHCRKNYCDLVTITNAEQQERVQEKAKKASTTHVWLGLRYTCFMDLWFWVNDNAVCYQNWASEMKDRSCGMAAAMSREEGYEWFKKADTEELNFICAVK